MLACKKVTKKIGGHMVLKDVTLRLDPGDCVCITGTSGSGKTVLHRLLLGTDDATSGAIEIDGVALSTFPPPILRLYRSRLGIIFQEPQLFADMTVAENIAVPLELRGAGEALIRRRTAELLKRLGLTSKASLKPEGLSPGEKALVGIARAFAASPLIVLADEPLQLLDSTQTEAAIALFSEARAHGASIIAFTTNPGLAALLDARTLTLADGRIAEEGKRRNAEALAESHGMLRGHAHDTESNLPPVPLPPVKVSPKDGRKIRITAIHS